ncbi:MAG: 4Fe-4S binding protein [Candidatus Omnitrophica bacterium]|nr:4Fe-4S binding protein [Candidatus Omnitrophota bacterium]
MAEKKVKLNEEECVGCGVCVDACEKDVLEMTDDVVKIVHQEKCDGCNSCVEACPNEALSVSEK